MPVVQRFFAFASMALFLPAVSMAQEGRVNVLDEVTVTAQKREQNIQDVGISMSAFSGEQMKALGVTNTSRLPSRFPGCR